MVYRVYFKLEAPSNNIVAANKYLSKIPFKSILGINALFDCRLTSSECGYLSIRTKRLTKDQTHKILTWLGGAEILTYPTSNGVEACRLFKENHKMIIYDD